MARVENLPASIDFPGEEIEILNFWNKIDAFQTSLKQSAKKPRYTFYDGPPFATGMPHYGHLLAGTIKDVITRYAHQSGFHVERRFGWDCHGLPVEYEVDKKIGITGPHDVEKMGVNAYNDKCREIVMRYSSQWKEVVERIGRWIDFNNDYRTMYPWFMESVWWVFKQIFDKGLVYRGTKVMPFSTACATPLSNFEAGQNYKDVQDPAVVVAFPLVDTPDVSLVAWTTTPWTLPSNLALCVHPNRIYVKIHDVARKRDFIMMESRLSSLFKKEEEYKIIEKFKGTKLKGKSYIPLFDYFKTRVKNAFVILCDEYVTEDAGTGVVHQAPYFGEDDFRVCLANGVITKDMPMVCPVDPAGRFTDLVTDFKGQYVKDADKFVCQNLKQKNRLIQQSTINHNYPFCWRSDTPLIYKAVPTWFIRVESLIDKLLANNDKAYWVPEFVREKRFANWLRDARDWAVSRNRFWGTPIPIWTSEDFQEVICIGSIEELERISGIKITDLHKEHVDKITIPSKTGRAPLKRIPEVFDCWFESGSMPYAQIHYPFENTKQFEEGFPADFIAEGIDQTRGWFYTLLVISTALFDINPFKNLIVNGIVLAENGQKMSKRLQNYPDPIEVVKRNGADALRLYLINSPVVRAQNLRFSESGVRDVVKDVLLPWFNSLRFLLEASILPYETQTRTIFKFRPSETVATKNYMDKWILSFSQSLIIFFREELAAYRLYTVVPRLVKFIDHLVNWYIRMNRRRLKGDAAEDLTDWLSALRTLTKVLFQLTCMMAPFTPFFSEFTYQHLKNKLDFTKNLKDLPVGFDHVTGAPDSVHYLMVPEPNKELIQAEIELTVSWMQTTVDLGRLIRTQCKLPLKAPLLEGICIHPDPEVHRCVRNMEPYIIDELNIRKLTVTSDKTQYGVKLKGVLNHSVLGQRLKKDYKAVVEAINKIPDAELEKYTQTGTIVIAGQTLSGDDLTVIYTTSSETPVSNTTAGKKGTKSMEEPKTLNRYEAASDRGMLVLLDTTVCEELEDERIARELANRIQRCRKKANLVPEEPIAIAVRTDSKEILRILEKLFDLIYATVKQPIVWCATKDNITEAFNKILVDPLGAEIISDSTSIPPDDLDVIIFHRKGITSSSLDLKHHVPVFDEGHSYFHSNREPLWNFQDAISSKHGCSYVKIIDARNSKQSDPKLVLLENPKDLTVITDVMDLEREVRSLLGWTSSTGINIYRKLGDDAITNLNTPNVFSLSGLTIYAK